MTLLPRTIVPRLLVFTGVLLLLSVGAAFFLVRALEVRIRSQVDLAARLYSALLTLPSNQELPADLVDNVLSRLDFPIVIADPGGIPLAWRNIPGIKESPVAVPYDSLSVDEQNRIREVMQQAQAGGRVVHLLYEGYDLGRLFFTPPPLLRLARALPWVLLIAGVLSLAGMIWSAHTLSDAYARELWALFAKGLAHQMGTPLSSLFGWLEHLKSSPEECPPTILEEMEQDLEDLKDISLRFSRIGQPPTFLSFDLAEAVERWASRWKRRWLRGVELVLDLQPAVVRGDEILLRWAVENLVKNAMEASREGDVIRISLETYPEGVRMRVVDQGVGIPEDVRRNLFAMRVTTKPRGWGMGLWVVRKIVEEWHAGKVRLIASRPGHTEFEILLPRAT